MKMMAMVIMRMLKKDKGPFLLTWFNFNPDMDK